MFLQSSYTQYKADCTNEMTITLATDAKEASVDDKLTATIDAGRDLVTRSFTLTWINKAGVKKVVPM
jgi:hypothetical protein